MFMLLFILQQIDFNIKPPLPYKVPGEFGYWSLLGVATNMKSHIHFLADQNRHYGGIGHRLPMHSDFWSAEFTANIESGSLLFSFTEDVFPYSIIIDEMDGWSGFVIKISNDEEQNQTIISAFVTSELNGTQELSLCSLPSKYFTLSIQKCGQNVSVSFINSSLISKCGSNITISPLSSGYFSFFSTTASGLASSQLYNLDVSPEFQTLTSDFNISKINDQNRQRILIQNEHFHITRETIPYINNILDEINNSNDILGTTKKTPQEIHNEIRFLLRKVYIRLQKGLSLNVLQKLVLNKITQNLQIAENKIEKRRSDLGQISDQISNAKKIVKNEMLELRDQISDEMDVVKQSTQQSLHQYAQKRNKGEVMINEAKERGRETKSIWIGPFLFFISGIECVCYIAFFFAKKKKTNNFKKID